jgi:peptidylprolyl isomerase
MIRRFSKAFIILAFIFLGCDNKVSSVQKEQAKTSTVKEEAKKEEAQIKPPVKKSEMKPADSIDDRNTVAFLEKYGALNPETRVRIKTRLGNIDIRLYEDAPLHRANFVFLSKVGYFDTTCFYRVVPDFIIQGGESERIDTQAYKHRYKRYTLPSEFRSHRKHKYGAVALARDWENNPSKRSTAFEFYIIQNRNGAHHLDGEHTVFGEVVAGFETIDKIVNLEAGGDEWPLEDVFMEIEVLR